MMKNVTTLHAKLILNVLAMFLALALVLPGAAYAAAPDGEAWGVACAQLDGRKVQKACCKNQKGECVTACYGQGLTVKQMSECDSGCKKAKSECQEYVFNN
ncbi:MAG: hypothetical protein ACE5FC_03585 [Myxococcota bacterium]